MGGFLEPDKFTYLNLLRQFVQLLSHGRPITTFGRFDKVLTSRGFHKLVPEIHNENASNRRHDKRWQYHFPPLILYFEKIRTEGQWNAFKNNIEGYEELTSTPIVSFERFRTNRDFAAYVWDIVDTPSNRSGDKISRQIFLLFCDQ